MHLVLDWYFRTAISNNTDISNRTVNSCMLDGVGRWDHERLFAWWLVGVSNNGLFSSTMSKLSDMTPFIFILCSYELIYLSHQCSQFKG